MFLHFHVRWHIKISTKESPWWIKTVRIMHSGLFPCKWQEALSNSPSSVVVRGAIKTSTSQGPPLCSHPMLVSTEHATPPQFPREIPPGLIRASHTCQTCMIRWSWSVVEGPSWGRSITRKHPTTSYPPTHTCSLGTGNSEEAAGASILPPHSVPSPAYTI